MLISSIACVIIDPFASLLFGLMGPVIYFLFEKYGASINFPGYSVDSILMCIISGILSAICCAGRNNRTITLPNPLSLGGLQIAQLFISIGLALVFGIIGAFIFRCVSQPQ